jgi:hypothetical protein
MSDTRLPEDGETTVLHLDRFAHGAAPAGQNSGSAESPTELMRKAASEAVAERPHPVVVPRNAAPLTPDELLGAVAYCYVNGVFSSADIERKMLRNAEFREALGGFVPDPATIRRFRRLNREAFQIVLEKFYAQLRRRPGGLREASSKSPGENTAVIVRREAVNCLDQATFVDGMSDF